VSFLAGIVGLVFLAIYWILRLWHPDWEPVHNRPLMTYSAVAVLLGAQMMSIGFLAELMTAYMGKDQESYSIKERTTEVRQEAAVNTNGPGSPPAS